MSFLAPLYILGALAIAAPVVFHLIRRTPRGEVPFSSLMFLQPTPPRLTRRSRLDDLPLLLLRAAALGLLALAFARPFLRSSALLAPPEAERRRIALLIDTSASMRRADLWAQAQAQAARVIAEGRPGDALAVLAFDGAPRTLVTFAESASLPPDGRKAVARAAVERLSPTYGATDLGRALVAAVAATEDAADATAKAGRVARRIVLVSDLAQGSRHDALGEFEWPADVDLDLRPVSTNAANAGAQWLADAEPEPGAGTSTGEPPLRVRVANDPGAKAENFQLAWIDAAGKDLAPAVAAYVPPGESRVVNIKRHDGATRLALRGDAHPFDNTLYLAAAPRETATVLYAGSDAPDDPNGSLYYLRRVFEDSPVRPAKVATAPPNAAIDPASDRATRLVVVDAELPAESVANLKAFAEAGGTVLFVAAKAGPSPTLAAMAGGPGGPIDEAPAGGDALLAEIAFDHPLFAPLAGPQFNDFTHIRFWKHRRLADGAIPDGRVLARFEGGDPAIVEKPLGRGRLVVLASGWAPADSQLARSSKFVPIMAALLAGREPPPAEAAGYTVGDRVPLPADAANAVVRKPDGASVNLPAGAEAFDAADTPGVYELRAGPDPRPFAVNLDPLESRTAPLAVETLERLGCRLAKPDAARAIDPDAVRQMQNAELEGSQKLWRSVLLAAIIVLIIETVLSGRRARNRGEAVAS
jgi:hypothetical protein